MTVTQNDRITRRRVRIPSEDSGGGCFFASVASGVDELTTSSTFWISCESPLSAVDTAGSFILSLASFVSQYLESQFLVHGEDFLSSDLAIQHDDAPCPSLGIFWPYLRPRSGTSSHRIQICKSYRRVYHIALSNAGSLYNLQAAKVSENADMHDSSVLLRQRSYRYDQYSAEGC